MNINQKMLLLLIGLIISMYYWITTEEGIQRIISMFALVTISYLLGKFHNQKIMEGELQYEKSRSQ